MAKIYNSDVTKGLANNAGIQQNVDKTPNELAEKIVPTFETNPVLLRRTNIVASSSIAGTIYTTPANKDFYLTGFMLLGSYAAAGGNCSVNLTATPRGGAAIIVGGLRFDTTAIIDTNSQTISVQLPAPLLLNRSSNITLGVTTTTGYRAVIYGYEVDSSNA